MLESFWIASVGEGRALDTPRLHLQRHTDTGLFDPFAAHLDATNQHARDPIQPNPDIDFHGRDQAQDRTQSIGG